MRLKSFYAKTMMEAMQMVRDTLGENAIIVATREEAGTVRLTAAIDEDTPASHALGFGARAPLYANNADDDDDFLDDDNSYEAEEGRIVEQLTDILLRHGTPTDVMDAIISTATMMGLVDVRTTLRQSIEHMFPFHPLPQKGNRKAIMLVGVPGSGKTLFATKLATRYVLAGQRPAVISTDTVRAGGTEQLAAFTKILNIPLHKAKDAAELREKLKVLKDADAIIIDTAGTNPFDVDDMRTLSRLTEAGTIEPVLVQAAGGDAEEMAEIGRCFAILGVQRQLATRLDITRKLGGLLATAHKAGLAFADISLSPMPSDGLKPLTPQMLVALLLGEPIGDAKIASPARTKSNTNAAIRGRTTLR